jgi:hypothetical protein
MTNLQKTAFALVLASLSFFSAQYAAAQPNPCLCMPAEATNCNPGPPMNFNTAGRTVQMRVVDNPRSLDNFSGARYKAFWMFGDGNFRYYPHRDSLSDVGTLTETYTYRRGGNYVVGTALTEKKSNTKPPLRDRTIRVLNVPNVATPAPNSPFVVTLSANNKTADILPSDSLRPHEYETAFAVSLPRDAGNTGVYFFFNGQINGSNINAALMHEFVALNLPDYAAGSAYTTGTVASLGSYWNRELGRKFQHYVYVPISSSNWSAMPTDADFTEYRVFPILKTVWNTPSPSGLPKSRFLAVVVGSGMAERPGFKDGKPTSAGNLQGQSFYTEDKLAELDRLRDLYFPNANIQEPIYYDSAQNPIYLRGMYETNVPMVGSIDPNELEILSICPKEGGKYEVKLRLQVCNKGIIPENDVQVRLIDHTGGSFTDLAFSSTPAPVFSYDAPSNTWRFSLPGGLEAVLEPTDLLPGTADKAYEPKCRELYFTLTADANAVQRIAAGNALEMCVTFVSSGLPDECGYHFEIQPTRSILKQGYKCGGNDVPSGAGNCGVLCLLLVLVLVAVLVWWFFNKDR